MSTSVGGIIESGIRRERGQGQGQGQLYFRAHNTRPVGRVSYNELHIST